MIIIAAKIKISYTEPEELEVIVELLSPILKKCKSPDKHKGEYKKAYIELKD